MTRLQKYNFRCKHCNQVFSRVLAASINTFMSPNMIQNLIENGIELECPHCQNTFQFPGEIMIVSFDKTMIYENHEDKEVRIARLKEGGILDENGNFETMESRLSQNTDIDSEPSKPPAPYLHPPPKTKSLRRKDIEEELKRILK